MFRTAVNEFYTTTLKRLLNGSLFLLVLVTLFSVTGFGVFGVHPELLTQLPSAASIYGAAFMYSARVQVWLSLLTIVLFLLWQVKARWIPAFVAIYLLSLSSELLGTTFGIPFGEYSYSGLLGWKWFDKVPYLIPFSWFTMTVPSFVLARNKFFRPEQWGMRIILGATLLTTWDLALDPAMSYLTSYWIWGESGAYFGMPAINLLGWWVTGAVLMVLVEGLNKSNWAGQLSAKWSRNYYVLILALPVGMNAVAGAWLAVVTTVVVAGILLWYVQRDGLVGAVRTPLQDADIRNSPRVGREASLVEVTSDVGQDKEQGWAYFRSHSRSFSFSSLFLGRRHRENVSRLYALCRVTDDIVDGRMDGAKVSRADLLSIWRATVMASFRHASSGYEWLDGIASRLRESGLEEEVIEDFFSGIHSDLGHVRVKSRDEMMSYAYGVASTVGIMMCHLFGVKDEWRLERAASLGQAMQLTNIIRDVGEDLGRDRIYIPETMLRKSGLSVEDIQKLNESSDPERIESYRRIIRDLTSEAERLYERGWEAIPFLPMRFGLTVSVAASVYRAIHRKLEGREEINLSTRVWTTPLQKVGLAAAGVTRYFVLRVVRTKSEAAGNPALINPQMAESSSAR